MDPHREAGRDAASTGDAGLPAMLRAFFAIPLDETARRAVGAVVRTLRERPGGDAVRWVRQENLHVTLRFLGEIGADRVEPLLRCAGEQTAALAPFELRVGALQAFPSARRPRVVALRVEPVAPLEALAAAVERGVVAAGLPAEERRFRAHLTLGRVRPRGQCPDVTGPDTADADPVPVTQAVLFRSELHQSGARYTPIGSAPLAPAR